MEAGAGSEAAAAAEAEATAGLEEPREESEDEALLSRAQKLISKIVANQANPNPRLLHTLATMLEAQELRYVQESGSSSFNNARASHSIGRLCNLVRENDEFYEAISSKFLSESRYSVTVRAASARILLSCSLVWMYPHVFDDAVLDNVKTWVMEDPVVSGDECNWKKELGSNKPTDSEMLRAYATGLLAMSLAGGGQVVEDILTSGLSAKLMRFLRARVLGEASSSQRDTSFPAEAKHASVANPTRGRDENRGRSRQVLDTSRFDGSRIVDEGLLGEASTDRDVDRNIAIRQVHGELCWADGGESLKSELTDSSSEVVGTYEMVEEDADLSGDGWHNRNLLDGKSKYSERLVAGRSTRDEDADENVRDDSSRRRVNRGWPRTRGKGRSNEGILENERTLTSPSSGLRLGGMIRGSRDRSSPKNEEIKKVVDIKKNWSRIDGDGFVVGEDNDDRFRDCSVGSRDISEMVKKAIGAAEAEARGANAPAEAIKAAGDAAAELVKTAALEVWKSTDDEEAAVLAACKAASTVVDAAKATEVSRSSSKVDEDLMDAKAVEPREDEELEDFIILDDESLAQIREKYCIQCLEILGEYVEALGPILHEKGVDVCLALLQRSFKVEEAPDHLALLPEVLKLICALAAHRKFAALFVDRGGIQKLLSVRRVSQTFFGLSSCLFTIGTLQGIMERVCALPSDVVNQVVELALQLLECPVDQARKNAAIFFASAFVFRAVLDSFDGQDGLQKMLNLLHGAASIRSGGNSGTLGMPNVNLRNDRSPAEVLTTSEKQIAYHTCVALRQYFRAHLLLVVDFLRPNKSSRGVARSNPSARAAYKPLDISNEAMDSVFLQIQRDRKLGSAFVRARWPAVDKFLASNGHITMLELCQAPSVERYLHDLAQYALGVLHIVTFVPYSRKLIVNATLSNDRVGMAVILDAANGACYVDPEVIHPALNVLVNLVCPPPSISNKPSVPAHGPQSASVQMLNGPSENRERHSERYMSDRSVPLPVQNESRERNGESNLVERSGATALSTPFPGSSSQTAVSSGVVGDRRITLGPGAGCAGLAAQLEQGYHQAREAVRAHNGIKVLLHLLHPRMITPPAALDCIRALACRVLLGLARDETIAHILTKLQVGKKLSELIRDSGSQASGNEKGRWQTELAQVAIELIAIVTNSGRASTLAATDAAAPTLRRIERAAIAAATPITYHSRELLLLIHEHLQASGLTATAALLQKEADLTPLPSSGVPTPPLHQTSVQETSNAQLQWPSCRAPCGFLSEKVKMAPREEDSGLKSDSAMPSVKKKSLVFSSIFSQGKSQPPSHSSIDNKTSSALKSPSAPYGGSEAPSLSALKSNTDAEPPLKTPILLPMKRKLMELRDSFSSPAKRLVTTEIAFQPPVSQTPNSGRRICMPMDVAGLSPVASYTPRDPFGRMTLSSSLGDISVDLQNQSTPGASATPMTHFGLPADPQPGNIERMTLDSLVVQYLKHQHRQCPAPITTLPPLSLLHPHVCPEPSRNLNAPANATARVSTREFRKQYSGIHAHRRDRQFIYSRFRPCRTCRDDTALLTCITFLGGSSRIATGCHSGELKIFDANNGNVFDSQACHQTPVTLVQSAFSGGTELVLSSSSFDVRLWDATSISGGPLHSFEGCKTAHFSNSGTVFAALSSDTSHREVLLYDVQTCNMELRLTDSANSHSVPVRGHAQSLIHFSPSDAMLLWNGVLWDRRSAIAMHRFDQFTDYGGGGFHPAGNEVIINSEVWDLRKFRLLRSVPSLDQTVITFNGGGDVIYAILRRNLEDIMSAVHARRVRHPLYPAFRTIDAVNYSDIATVQVDRCILDFAADPTDSFVGVVAMDDHDEMYSSARLFEVGRKRPTDDDSDPDNGGDTDEEDEDEDNDTSEADVDPILGADLDGDGDTDSDDMSNDEDDDDIDTGDELDEDRDFDVDDLDFEGGHGLLEITAEGDEDDSEVVESLSSGEEDFAANAFGF
ncbi:DDB1- and CUL4-associated factor homolog 1-like [Phoenix dactylifera]|uniref:DDB1- and CUL4-associated factor homolog 1-like n=1 Tax=Phoenix dactylifera TaxID=42345 RepID=A0A8B8ZFR7_PHODC|nr:DDB1- and CUL4-associated factor homolog 1-like [Phoenix dactylifera]